MQIKFKVTAKEAWKPRWRTWKRSSLRLTMRLCALPLTAYYACPYFRLDVHLATIIVVVIGIVPLASLVLALIDLLRKAAAVRAATRTEWIAEVGARDFRLGALPSEGHYYHWTRVAAIDETDDGLFLVLTNGTRLGIPRSAFPAPAALQAFLAEARHCWNAARVRENMIIAPEDETVWPPAPRPGA